MKRLNAGPLEVGYDNGSVRRVLYGNTEVLRMIYFASRDHNWNTLPAEIDHESIKPDNGSFQIQYQAQHFQNGAVVVDWTVKIAGTSDGAIIFEIAGNVKAKFRKNRVGFCVLHPPGLAGEVCALRHPDGTETASPFPAHVAPENPFKNIQSMRWPAAGGRWELLFEGDIFETEDQRNWGDASFKTFCTPLERPFPVDLNAGERIFQRVTFRPAHTLQPAAPRSRGVRLSNGGRACTLPRLGIAASTEVSLLSPGAMARLRDVRFHHYRIDLSPDEENWVTSFSEGYEMAHNLGLPLEVVLHLTANYAEELEAFTVLCQQNKVRLRKVLLLTKGSLVTGKPVISQLPSLKAAFQNVYFGVGTNYNFTEINQNRLSVDGVDFVSFSIDPQEHAFDDLTIMENGVGFRDLVASAKAIYGDHVAVHISPLTLRKRFNPYATNPADLFIPEGLKADPRQKTGFAAAWTFAALLSLADGGASSTTLFQTAGNQGVVAADGEPFPVYEALRLIAPFQGKRVTIPQNTDPLSVQALALDGNSLALANLTDDEQSVDWRGNIFRLEPFEVKVV